MSRYAKTKVCLLGRDPCGGSLQSLNKNPAAVYSKRDYALSLSNDKLKKITAFGRDPWGGSLQRLNKTLRVFVYFGDYPSVSKLTSDIHQNKQPTPGARVIQALRREGDSNPRSRDSGTTVFETAAFDHSAISPYKCGLTKIAKISYSP